MDLNLGDALSGHLLLHGGKDSNNDSIEGSSIVLIVSAVVVHRGYLILQSGTRLIVLMGNNGGIVLCPPPLSWPCQIAIHVASRWQCYSWETQALMDPIHMPCHQCHCHCL
jgi:hypothetical protein